MRYTEGEWLAAQFGGGRPVVEGLVMLGQSILLVATKKSGKSLLSTQLALCVAHGLPFLDRWKVPVPRKVVYLAFENNDEDLQRTFMRQRAGLGVGEPSDNLVLYRIPFLHLATPDGRRTLFTILDADRPDLLIVDPFYRTIVGSVNDDGVVGAATGVLTAATMEYGHASWMPHHQHRPKHDMMGQQFEGDAERWAGSWALTAWCDAMYGFKMTPKTHKAQLLNLDTERTPRMGEGIKLDLVDEPERLVFVPALEERLVMVPDWEHLPVSELARRLGGMHHEEVRRAVTRVQKNKVAREEQEE